MTKHDRIAIFQADWPMQSQTVNCSLMLAEAGYDVELYVCNAWKTWTLIERERLSLGTKIKLHDLTPASQRNVFCWYRNLKGYVSKVLPVASSLHNYMNSRLRRITGRGVQLKELIDPNIVQRSLEDMSDNCYLCFIGVEKKGLIWAGIVAEKLKVPFIYYSLELYTEEYQRTVMKGSGHFAKLREAECDYHRRCYATIIQDSDRARVLLHDNGLDMSKASILDVPVSVMGGPYKNRSTFLQDLLGISKRRKIVLYFGLIWEKRYAFELAQAVQNFPEDWVLVMHGYADQPSTLEKIKALDRNNRVNLSLNLVPTNQIQELVGSADIGLVLYSPFPSNDRLTAFASEKMALYMQCGVPFIAFDYPGYRRLANEERCGVVIRSLDDLPNAIRTIFVSYDEFRRRAYTTFHKYYDYGRNFVKVTDTLECLRPAGELFQQPPRPVPVD